MILSRQFVRGLQRRALAAPQIGAPDGSDPMARPVGWAVGPYSGSIAVQINR